MSSFSHDLLVDRIERKCGVKAIQGDKKGVFYFFDDEKKGIAIAVCRDGETKSIGLTKNQAYALVDEFKDICDMVFGGRGDEPTNN